MGADNRDWYREWWRKRTRYTERAMFRMGHHEVVAKKTRAAWRRNWLIVVAIVAGFTALAILR